MVAGTDDDGAGAGEAVGGWVAGTDDGAGVGGWVAGLDDDGASVGAGGAVAGGRSNDDFRLPLSTVVPCVCSRSLPNSTRVSTGIPLKRGFSAQRDSVNLTREACETTCRLV